MCNFIRLYEVKMRACPKVEMQTVPITLGEIIAKISYGKIIQHVHFGCWYMLHNPNFKNE